MKKDKTLHLFTTYFPAGKFEVYMESEIIFLAKEFSEIIIYPLRKTEGMRPLPENCKVVYLENASAKIGLRGVLSFIGFFITEIFQSGPLKTVRHIHFLKAYFKRQFSYFLVLKELLKDKKQDHFYSNWFVDWSLTLALLKRAGVINDFVVRAHRYDLYTQEYPIGFIPFRNFQVDHCDAVASISADGKDYLEKQFPTSKEKFYLFRLGTFNRGTNPINTENVFRIVTCSNLKTVKRVHLLVEALKNINGKTEWHHFGDGDLRARIEEQAKSLPANVSAHFYGRISSDELFEIYRSKPFDVFINVSASEGIPVSIMEAVSFGIPVVATDVGGTREIINDETGVLIPADFSVGKLNTILNTWKQSEFCKEESRKKVKESWNKNFNAEICFPAFASFLADKKYLG